jgi:hypothetical protein
MKRGRIILASVLVLLQFCSSLWAWSTTSYEAEKVVTGWLKADDQPLGTSLGRRVANVETFTNDKGQPVYYIVYLHPSGFVIVAGDDLVEPIIGFADDGTFDPSLDNPLGALVTNDLNGRIAAARDVQRSHTTDVMETAFESQAKWQQLESLADRPVATGLASISDVRVAPLVQSKWSQGSVCGSTCYNCYTPNNYVCGCVATAMAQLMRYHRHPATGIGVYGFTIRVDDVEQTAYTRGGNGSGGPYEWDLMMLDPNCGITAAQRRAIGALCYDAGVSVNMSYTRTASAAGAEKPKDALTTIFKYGHAVKGYNSGNNIGPGLIRMINPNLDAKDPLYLCIKGIGNHAILCDGYGINSATLYHHLNMGWYGMDDAWYNLPNILSPTYTSVYTCVYNIHVSGDGDGEMISGRVLDRNGTPIAGATMCAEAVGQTVSIIAESDSKGIYAFSTLNSNTTYAINALADGYDFSSQFVTTGTSTDYSSVSGNVWGIDFVGSSTGDFDGDEKVAFKDFSIMAQSWRQDESLVDIAPGPFGDDIVDYKDLAVLAENWLTAWGIPPLPGQASEPHPANNATDVSLTTDLSWTGGIDVTSHEVYFGTSSPPSFIRNQTATTLDPCTMAPSTTYYWRIDGVNLWGTTTGTVWSFTTMAFEATNPNPADGATEVSTTADLSWTAGADATSHDVYFGTSSSPPFIRNQTDTIFDPGEMTMGTTYYWRIDEVSVHGTTTGTVWTFTAFGPPP